MSPISPAWFSGFDALFELFFAVISLTISYFAYKIYQLSDQRPVKLLSFSFLFISLAYVARSMSNFLPFLDVISIYTHIILFLTGLSILLYMTLKPNRTTFWVLLAATLLSLVFISNILLAYYILSSVYLALISWHYIQNFLSNRQTKTLLVALAFIFLFFGSFHFFMSVNHELFYVIGYFLELLAYLLILANLYLVLKK
ncbi:MAG TPA: hypothetical protein VJB66_02670 [Candidatus Nanoarchaeia archaeon]|nr:hypothetical protein [Candidatus Nanoarchaeia archaeon]